jgi:6-phosphogluconolactonase
VTNSAGNLSAFIDWFQTELQPHRFNISPDEKYLISFGQKSNSASLYRINKKNGILNFQTKMEVGKNPNWVEIIELPK